MDETRELTTAWFSCPAQLRPRDALLWWGVETLYLYAQFWCKRYKGPCSGLHLHHPPQGFRHARRDGHGSRLSCNTRVQNSFNPIRNQTIDLFCGCLPTPMA